MKKVIVTYGLIAGAIMGAMFFVTVPFWHNGMINFDNGMVIGYTTQVIALSLVFFGIKSYRDNHLQGVISFWKACKVGILITLIAVVLYCVSWEICMGTVFQDFPEKIEQHYLGEIESRGLPEAKKKAELESITSFMVMYENPVIRFAITMMEVLPLGVVVTILSAALLRRKEILPTT